MRSAFGVEHGEVSKGVPKGLAQVAAKYSRESATNPGKKIAYAHERLQAKKHGKLRASAPPHLQAQDMTRGLRARMRSREALA